jgi:hypothetical protein
MILSLLGGLSGGLLRFVPEIFKMVNAKGDRDHEYKMSKLQMDIDLARSKQDIDKVHAQTESAQITGEMTAYMEAIKSQGQLTGVKWVDGLNATVRPFLTYWWMLLFSVYKGTVIYDAWMSSTGLPDFGSKIWNADDWGILSMIISFWFVDRVFRKHSK